MQTRDTVEGLYNSFHLRTSLCKNQTSWEMKIFNPLQILHAVRCSGGCTKIKSSAYHPDSECCTFFHGNLSNPKSSEDTLLLLVCHLKHVKVGWSTNFLTPVNCHKHILCHDGVTLYFSMKFPSVAPKKTRNGHFWYISSFPRILSKNNQKKRRKP